MRTILYMYIALLFACATSCSKSLSNEEVVNLPQIDSVAYYDSIQNVNLANRISGASVGYFQSAQKYNLNIVYFIPNDVQPATNFQKRLSELMLWTQNWYKQQMTANGYPNKTFGLFTNAAGDNVRFNIIFGKKDKTQYDYNNGSSNVIAEINEFYTANPQLKTGDHNLIILPSFYTQSNGVPGGGPIGPPFYGLGRNCFALDYADLDIMHMGTNQTALGQAFITWFGGLVHELGHGLNLPHNRQKVSEGSDPQKGMALMWAGNSTLGLSPTFLTGADAAVLNANQVFNNDNGIYYGSVNTTLQRLNAVYDQTKAAIILSGKYASDKVVTNVLCFNDPNVNNEGTGVNKDYNAIAWAAKPIGVDSFYIEMPINELVEKSDGMTYEAKLKFVHANGVVKEYPYLYKFQNGIPLINFGDKTYHDKSNWQVIGFSSQEISTAYPGFAIRAIDGNINTYWHSNWSQQPASIHPHFIAVDFGISRTLHGVSLWQRLNSFAGNSKDIEIYTSTDNQNWSLVKATSLASSGALQNIDFATSLQARYLKVVVLSSYGTNENNCSLAEIATY